MFDIFKRAKKDPEEIANEAYKEYGIEVKDEEPTPEGSGSKEENNQVDKDKEEVKSSQEEDETPEDSKPNEEDKEEELSEEEQKLMDTADDDLDDESKTKKQAIVDKSEAKRNSGAERRIKELDANFKALTERMDSSEAENKQKIAELEAENKVLREKKPSDGIKLDLVAMEQERIAKYLEEDRGKQREDRREMSREEIDEWFVEDPVEANTWLNMRFDRRKTDKQKDVDSSAIQSKVDDVMHSQNLARIRVDARHPELKKEAIVSRRKELAGEGKNPKEIEQIMHEENPKYRIMYELWMDKKFREKVEIAPNGPEIMEKAMLKRLENPNKGGELVDLRTKVAELEDMLKKDELNREPVGVGMSSRTKGGGKVKDETKHNPALEAELAKMKKKGYNMTVDEHKEFKDRRRDIPGAEVYEHEAEKRT